MLLLIKCKYNCIAHLSCINVRQLYKLSSFGFRTEGVIEKCLVYAFNIIKEAVLICSVGS